METFNNNILIQLELLYLATSEGYIYVIVFWLFYKIY